MMAPGTVGLAVGFLVGLAVGGVGCLVGDNVPGIVVIHKQTGLTALAAQFAELLSSQPALVVVAGERVPETAGLDDVPPVHVFGLAVPSRSENVHTTVGTAVIAPAADNEFVNTGVAVGVATGTNSPAYVGAMTMPFGPVTRTVGLKLYTDGKSTMLSPG
jgi:hypothetical protein